jgi:tetratricopeptide (TPR) repeat protein
VPYNYLASLSMRTVCFLLILLAILALMGPAVCEAGKDPIHLDPEVDAAILQANELYLDARFDEGIQLLQDLAKRRPNDPALSYFTANGYWWKIFRVYIYDKEAKTTDFDKSFDTFLKLTMEQSERLVKRNSDDVVGLFYLGNAYSLKSRLRGLRGSYFMAGRDAANGKRYLERVLKLQPAQVDASYNLGLYNYLAGALPGYAKVLKMILFLPGGNKEKGLTLLQQASEKSIYFGDEARLLLARFYADFEDQPQEAVQIVEDFRMRHPDNPWFDYWAATIYADELNEYARAEELYTGIIEKCAQHEPGYTVEVKNQTALRIARVHFRQLDPERAIREIRVLIGSKPTEPSWINARLYLELGNIYDQIGMRDKAVLAYKQVLSYRDYRNSHEEARKLLNRDYNQKNADIFRLNLDGRRLAAAGEYEAAEASLKTVLVQYPNNEQTLYALAETYCARGSYDEAADLLLQILKRSPKDPKWLVPAAYVRLGKVYEARQLREAAKHSYESALDLNTIASEDRNRAKRALRQMAQQQNNHVHGTTNQGVTGRN